MFERVGDPRLQLVEGIDRASRVVGGAEVDEVGVDVGIGHRQKAVFSVGIEVEHLAAVHDVGVDVDGVDGVGDKHDVADVEQVGDVADIALRAVADENLIRVEGDAVSGVIALNGAAQEIVALLGAVPVEGGGVRHLVDRAV